MLDKTVKLFEIIFFPVIYLCYINLYPAGIKSDQTLLPVDNQASLYIHAVNFNFSS